MEAYENYNIAQHGKAKKEYFALGEVFHFFKNLFNLICNLKINLKIMTGLL